MKLPVRKSTRLPGYDYSTRNYYFITICTHEKECIFGKPNVLNELGKIAKDCIEAIEKHYPQTRVDKYVVMPNHVHMILILGTEYLTEKLPNVNQVIGQYKMSVSKRIHKIEKNCKVWQRSFHDHIIRDHQGYINIWQYIDYNPEKWQEDCFYRE